MAMLAEPKRKQKFSFDPRNTNWSNDETKFGHRLMEKMGWSKGKGLGANEDGKTENISVSVKNDTRGVGCSKSHVDNWIAHQDDFNALLANLGQDHGTDDSKQEDTDKKVISLEQKSRTSKGRLHYQKFTKGKDLSLKSETDLDCVFGKRKSQSGTITPQTQSGTNTPHAQSESSSDNEEQSHGFNTVTSTDSVQDYFKKKMAERLNKLKSNEDTKKLEDCFNSDDRNETNITSEMNIDSNEIQIKNKRKLKKRKPDSNEINDQDTEILNGRTEDVVNEEEIVKKKKKSKKKKVVTECENETDLNELNAGHIQRDTLEEEKTSKKKKRREIQN
ncbi:PIN2/TERF1-interacting telomerase inhibitor 1-like [Mercenaria mercenaria]|uniref:PIN2/TERF1-interacting telomerase inhibitor 1-like n=1 Tax=Mercenaria mercenaria TaxID=6596 RepID=UPI00234EAF96|nr:PIN2/TERF1-interacting telomerase inhibitor 1-like [Mercenaria mercenaria]XP_045175883.2 PIN2/TERF1-interacting telomerase inhibitor 1-like [Mercenaria mercenaria]